MNRQIIML